MYLKQFRNHQSNVINKKIPEILATLFTSYGSVPDDVLQEEEGKIIKRRDVSERSEENIKRADGRGLSIGVLVNR